MYDQNPSRRLPVSVVAGFSVLILATGSAVAIWGWHSIARKNAGPAVVQSANPSLRDGSAPPTDPNPAATQKPQPRMAPATEKTLEVFWINGNGKEVALVPVTMTLSAAGNSTAGIRTVLEQLLAGPNDSSVTTAIPKGTRLLDVAVKHDGIHINLSQAFKTGGGTTSMTARVGQILYTATSLNPNAAVWLAVEGKPLDTLGGEGLLLEQPLTRKAFEKDFTL